MNISILCSSLEHPIYPWLESWKARHDGAHAVELVQKKSVLSGGDILFLISCHEIVGKTDRERYQATLVIHASDLPVGRGWSPHVWQILNGQKEISVSLLEAEDEVDSGPIWAQRKIVFEGHELADEIHDRLFDCELELMDHAVNEFGRVQPHPQDARQATYYRKRGQEDSRIDPARPIAEQFDLLRVADQERYPAFFDFRGHRYIIKLEKAGDGNE